MHCGEPVRGVKLAQRWQPQQPPDEATRVAAWNAYYQQQAAQQAQEDRLLQHRLPALPLDADELAEYALDGRARHLARGSIRLQIVETSI